MFNPLTSSLAPQWTPLF